MSAFCGCSCSGGAAVSVASSKSLRHFVPLKRYSPVLTGYSIEAFLSKSSRKALTSLVVRASAVDSYENSSDFVKRMEQAWLISQQPRPVACSSCASEGHVECRWCGGTGFFVIGNNVLCEVPSRNTSCVICAGKGSVCCADCKGTGFRAKWLGNPPPL
ncbi:protein EMBRYO SAC DEVELOPMENT ARREST 3, chloroplastic [Phalaenopsis equestris]|uniref:protein EMBRYO SAC DEVELOPMENT ARREST 3, chloroplastic n=1 Tax=Phalaenopsis equestris TaxID=78828 RepID=UPI0009E330B0|nr:protein EMBRYO SAC DEVELOPMENT ARREST 3, chloroplastic [Phalaenopsis equestris]